MYGANLRTEANRKRLEDLNSEVFGADQPLVPMTGHPLLTDHLLHLGEFQVPRQAPSVRGESLLLAGQGPTLEMMASCLTQSWPVLLTSPNQAGKSALVAALASLKGTPWSSSGASSRLTWSGAWGRSGPESSAGWWRSVRSCSVEPGWRTGLLEEEGPAEADH